MISFRQLLKISISNTEAILKDLRYCLETAEQYQLNLEKMR
jgi:hypothetical protein